MCLRKKWNSLFWGEMSYRYQLGLTILLSEKAMAPHSSTLAWKIPWTGELGRLQSMEIRNSRRGLSDFTFTFHCHALEKEMATHSSVLAWRIPGTGEPGGLPSMGSHRVGYDWSDLEQQTIHEPPSKSEIFKRSDHKADKTLDWQESPCYIHNL